MQLRELMSRNLKHVKNSLPAKIWIQSLSAHSEFLAVIKRYGNQFNSLTMYFSNSNIQLRTSIGQRK